MKEDEKVALINAALKLSTLNKLDFDKALKQFLEAYDKMAEAVKKKPSSSVG